MWKLAEWGRTAPPFPQRSKKDDRFAGLVVSLSAARSGRSALRRAVPQGLCGLPAALARRACDTAMPVAPEADGGGTPWPGWLHCGLAGHLHGTRSPTVRRIDAVGEHTGAVRSEGLEFRAEGLQGRDGSVA